jgi:CAAX protease family protein
MDSVDDGVASRGTCVQFLAYVIAFHLLWIAWPLAVYPRLLSLGNTTLEYAVVSIGCRLLVWVVPVLLYVRYVDGVDPVGYLKLRSRIGRGVALAAVVTAFNVLGTIGRFGVPHPSLQRITWHSVLGTSLLVGVIEEIPYRGFMLQKFAERWGFWRGNVVTSALFLAVHVPGWIVLHALSVEKIITIYVFGFVMGLLLRYSGSLWAPILSHSANDFLSFVVFGL